MKFPLITAVVENETDELKDLKTLLLSRKDIFNVKETISDYDVARRVLKLRPFHLGIFDVVLDHSKDCYDLIKEVGPENFEIIAITTQFDSLPKKALKLRGCLTFEKPYTQTNLDEFIGILQNEVQDIQNLTMFEIPIEGGYPERVRQDKICFVQGKGNFTEYYIVNNLQTDYRVITSKDTFAEALNRLSNDVFVQIHRSVIFNITYYKDILSGRKFAIHSSNIIVTGIPSKVVIKCSKAYQSKLDKKLRTKH